MKSPATLPLLVEIGCEEIPARFLEQAQKDFDERLKQALVDARLLSAARASELCSSELISSELEPGTPNSKPGTRNPELRTPNSESCSTSQSFSTPRRLAVYVPEVLKKQPDQVEEVHGPPVRIAFDAEGKPTHAAEGFAAKNRVRVEDLIRVNTPKGEYVGLAKTTRGRAALEVLREVLPGVITSLSFPKSMYWTGKSGPRFIRPIRWIVALLGEGKQARVVPFEVAGVKSGRSTLPHRALGNRPVKVSGFDDYSARLREGLVELDPEKRRETVRRELKTLLEGSGLRAVEDKELEEWVVNSTEWPRALEGSFEQRFLKLPREILVTVMRDHQKYFAVEDQSGNLQPRFVAVLTVDGDPKGLIRAGHERVLTARFSDAEFFWNADQKVPLRDRLPLLEKVTYQEKLGSYADKVRRMEDIAREICRTLEQQGRLTAADTEHALRAVQLCKCDLTTQMVQEFPELQGVVGGLYAREQGEPEAVAEAIYDHYLPVSVEDRCPRSAVGAVVSLADKLDSVVAGFAAGLEPTGSSDPFGLRRAGNGIIKVAVEALPGADLGLWAGKTIEIVERRFSDTAQLGKSVNEFLTERLGYYLREVDGLRYDTVRAVVNTLAAGLVPSQVVAKGKALESVRDTEDFLALAQAAKRTRNILSKSASAADFGSSTDIDEGIVEPGPERELYDAYMAVASKLDGFEGGGEYEAALRTLATLRQPVDRFFDEVMVMDERRDVRANRLRLLAKLDTLVFSRLADLAEIESKA